MASLQDLKQNHEIFVLRSTIIPCRFTMTKSRNICRSLDHYTLLFYYDKITKYLLFARPLHLVVLL